jgi:hypothetical protein
MSRQNQLAFAFLVTKGVCAADSLLYNGDRQCCSYQIDLQDLPIHSFTFAVLQDASPCPHDPRDADTSFDDHILLLYQM